MLAHERAGAARNRMTPVPLDLPFMRRRHRAITVDVRVDEGEADALHAELLAIARRHDASATATAQDPRDLPWTTLSFVAIDVETTGFNADVDRVIEVGWVRFERGREVERYSSLVAVDADVPHAVRALTGITPAMLQGMPRFADVATDVVDALTRADFLVAYNAGFDRAFLSAELRAVGRSLPDVPFVDALAFVRDVDGPGHGSRRLVDVARRFGVSSSGAHRAENDARATGQLLLKLAPRLHAHSLAELLDKQERWGRLPASEPATTASCEPQGIGARLLSLFR